MRRSGEFFAAVSQAATNTPLQVTRTERGFDVTTNIADASWTSLLYKQGLRQVFTHHVMVDDGKYAIRDDVYDVRWQVGMDAQAGIPVPVLELTMQRNMGTVVSHSSQKTYGRSENGEISEVSDYTFNSEEGRRLIVAEAQRLGLKKMLDFHTRVGLIVGIGASIFALAVAVALVIAFALGAFG